MRGICSHTSDAVIYRPFVVSKLEYRELELVDCVAGFGMSCGLTEADMVVYCAPW